MDTTPKYVKMSEKSPLRETWEPLPGDFIYSQRDGVKILDAALIVLAELTPFGQNKARIKADMIPLYRQDQLQDMVFDSTVGMQSHCCAIYEFAISVEGVNFCLDDGSMEQLWLAFVMHEKYDKVWDDKKEEWVK